MAQRINYSDGYYYGDVANGEENGFGVFTWNSGNRYEGDWLNGQMHGYGTMYYANGDRYEGYWKEHAKHGQGVYYYADGDTQFGYWDEGDYVGTEDPDDVGYDDGGYYDDSSDGDYDSSYDDDDYDSEPTARQSAARSRLHRGLGGGSSKPTKKSAPKASSSGFGKKSSGTGNKKGKGKLIARIVFKSICCLFGLGIIALALVQFFATEGQVGQKERVSALIGQLMSGFFGCGLWLFYYGTIVALKKSGLAVIEELKDPSFWEVVSVTTTTTRYSDGSEEKQTYHNTRGNFIQLIVLFLGLFALIQTYYFIAAPILGPISLIRDIKTLKNEY